MRRRRKPLGRLAISLTLLWLPLGGKSAATHEEETSYISEDQWVEPTTCCWGAGPATVNGQPLTNSIYIRLGPYYNDTEETISFDLGRDWQKFRTTIGLRDDSEAGHSVVFQAFRDDVEVFSDTLTLGESVPVEIDITNALRFKWQVSAVMDQDSSWTVHPVLGSARTIRPKAHEHARNVDLSVRKRKARGTVSVPDGFSQCVAGVPVEIEHYNGLYWDALRTVQTSGEGQFAFRTPRSGSLRAIAPRMEMGAPWPSDVCDKDKSRKRTIAA